MSSSFGASTVYTTLGANWAMNSATFTNAQPTAAIYIDRSLWNNEDHLLVRIRDTVDAAKIVFTGSAVNGKSPTLTLPTSAITAVAPWWTNPYSATIGAQVLGTFSTTLNTSVAVTGLVMSDAAGLKFVIPDTTATVTVLNFSNINADIYIGL